MNDPNMGWKKGKQSPGQVAQAIKECDWEVAKARRGDDYSLVAIQMRNQCLEVRGYYREL